MGSLVLMGFIFDTGKKVQPFLLTGCERTHFTFGNFEANQNISFSGKRIPFSRQRGHFCCKAATNGETKVEEDDFGKIEVMPAWKFCLTSKAQAPA